LVRSWPRISHSTPLPLRVSAGRGEDFRFGAWHLFILPEGEGRHCWFFPGLFFPISLLPLDFRMYDAVGRLFFFFFRHLWRVPPFERVLSSPFFPVSDTPEDRMLFCAAVPFFIPRRSFFSWSPPCFLSPTVAHRASQPCPFSLFLHRGRAVYVFPPYARLIYEQTFQFAFNDTFSCFFLPPVS